MLITDAPAAVAAFDQVHEALHVALVAVVVAGEEIAVLVEHQLLRIAQAARDHLELGAIGIGAEHRAFIRIGDHLAFLALHVRAAVADRVVDLAVMAHRQAVEVVAGEVVAHAEAAQQLVLLQLAVGAFLQQPQARNVREPHLAVAREHARGDAVELGVEAVGECAALVGHAVAVGVFDQAHHFTLDGEILGLRAEHLAVQGGAVFDGARREVQFEHAHVVADVEHAAAIAVGLGDEQPALLVEIEGHRIRQHGLGGPQLRLHALRQREALDGECGVVRRRIDDRRWLPVGLVQLERLRRHCRNSGNEHHRETGN